MSTEQGQDGRAPGSVPNAFGNALAWKWAPTMPTRLRRSILTLLYALRAMANAAGELRFSGDRKPIRIQDIARAAGAREKDARRFLDAAIAAGVVGIKGERRRGKPTLYVLLLCPNPDWESALAVLEAKKEAPGKTPPPWQQPEEGSGPRRPNQFGPPPPELETEGAEEVRAPAAPMSSGDRRPIGSGPRRPNNPGRAKEVPHDPGEVVAQPHVDQGSPGEQIDQSQGQDDHDNPPPLGAVAAFAHCPDCHRRHIPRRPDGRCTACAGTTTATARNRSTA